MRCRDPVVLTKIRQAFEAGGDRRPPLQQWMASNFDELSTMLEDARPNWQHLADSFMDAGFRNLDGSDLKAGTVRQTWYRVRKRKETVRARKTTRTAPVEVLSSPAPVPRPLPTTSPPPPTATTVPPVNDALAAVVEEMNRRSGRI